MTRHKHQFVVRLDDARTLLFKGKKKSVEEVSKTRKGILPLKCSSILHLEKYNLATFMISSLSLISIFVSNTQTSICCKTR